MEKSLLTFVENHTDHVVSVYTYTLGNKLIPVLVVHDFDDETQEKLAHISEPGWIILTQNDLDHGDDVFCVVLLHIQCNSVCERGKDVINDIYIDRKNLRHHLEAQIRHVMINMREAILLGRTTGDLMPGLGLQLSRISCGLSFLGIQHDVIQPRKHILKCLYGYMCKWVDKVDQWRDDAGKSE